jgi:hypothetical protein
MNAIRLICPFIFLFGIAPLKVFCTGCNQQGPDTISTNTTIIGGCIINGDLVILNGGALHVDMTGGQPDTFVVRGNILLEGNATLFINADSGSTSAQFIVSNVTNNQRSIMALGTSRVILQYVEFRTQEGDLTNASSYYMNYNAQDSSAFSVTGCWLNTQTAWLLCNMNNQSTFIGSQSNELPTEIYLQDTAQISVTGVNTNIGIWLLFGSTTDTLNLPDQTGPFFSWQAGRGMGGVNASPWFLNVDSAEPGIGVQIQPFAKLVVNGMGAPALGEIHANLLFANSTDTIENLVVGLQNTSVAKGRLTLNNVAMGPIPWQLYAVSNENLFIKNSIVNEIGIVGPSNTVVVDSSILQLATLSALGTSGTTLTINNSQIWNQAIIADNTAGINISNCNVTGSWFSTDGQSHITVNGGCFFQNPAGCTENTMVNVNTGQPYCNPFIPAGFPQNLSPSTVTFNGVNSNCTTSIEDVNNGELHLTIYPNPFASETEIRTGDNSVYSTLTVYNAIGQQVRQMTNVAGPLINFYRDNLPAGVYFILLAKENKTFAVGKLVVTDN